MLVEEVHGVDELAVDVELELMSGAVADPDGCGALVALEMRQDLLAELAAAVDAVHDLQWAGLRAVGVRLLDAGGEPPHEPLGLVREPKP